MFKGPTTSTGFAVALHDEHAPQRSSLPTLIATVALVLSIAVVVTAVGMSAARAAQLF